LTSTSFLRGTELDNLPVQAPTKFELIINLKAVKAIGVTIPLPCSPAPTR
jgi:putative ABC transport system substrate-binding protein